MGSGGYRKKYQEGNQRRETSGSQRDASKDSADSKPLFEHPLASGKQKKINHISLALIGVGVVLCLTVVLLPLGVPLVMLGIGIKVISGMRSVHAFQKSVFDLVNDPERAGEKLEPYAKMRGKMLKATLDEMGVDLGQAADKMSGSGQRSDDKSSPNPEAAQEDYTQRLRKLHQLHVDGIITEEEFEREKKQILDDAN